MQCNTLGEVWQSAHACWVQWLKRNQQDWVVDVVPYADIWHVQHGRPSAQYLSYYSYTWMDWHELEQRIFFFLSVRCMILGF